MEMLELAAELKWCRERITALEAERDQLLARIDDTDSACADYAFAGAHTAREIIEKLHDRIRGYKTDRDLLAEANDQLRAELASWQEAFGLLTTLHGSMQIDVSDPLRMAKSIEVHVRAELAVLRGRIADDAALVSEYTLLLRDAYNLCNPAWPWMHGLRERIRAALGAKEEW